MEIDAEVSGLIEAQRANELRIAELGGPTVLNAVHDSVLMVQRDAKLKLVGYESPTAGGVDSGRLRASITPSVKASGNEVFGVVGSTVYYAPFVEEDTRPHWPPLAALETWAERHHTSAFLVARAISKRGTYGKHFLRDAFEANKQKIFARFRQAVAAIVNIGGK